MTDNTGWTPSPEENLLGSTDKDRINEYEARGIAKAEYSIFSLDLDEPISTSMILEWHGTAFGELYDWAGKWRTTTVMVGQLVPPQPSQVPQLMYQFIDNLNFKSANVNTREDHLDCLVYAHYEFIRIHPFNNGNGRTGRILMNLVATKLGYQPLELYHKAGKDRTTYIQAMREADKRNFGMLRLLIDNELAIL